jgi:bifunctional non-homologous end joining protein LigD
VGVSVPVSWDELDQDIRGTHFDIHNVPDRVAKQRKDPWADYWQAAQALSKAIIREMADK